MTVFLLSALMTLLGFLLLPAKDLKFCKRWGMFFCVSVILTLVSHIVLVMRDSGEGVSTHFGWPHPWFETWVSFDAQIKTAQLWLGPWGAYLLSDILFYFSACWLAYGLLRKIQSYS